MKTIRKLIVLLLVAAMSLSCFPMAALATEVEEVPQVEIVPEETVPEAVTAEETEPVAEETEPIIEETAPVIEETEPVIEETQPVIKETEPVIEETEPVIEETEPVIVEAEPAAPAETEMPIEVTTPSDPPMFADATVPDGLVYRIEDENTVTIMDYTGNASQLVIPEKIERKPVTAIFQQAFYRCTSLESITLCEGIQTIGYNAFNGCTNLKSIEIPDTVTQIGYGTFDSCSNLTTIQLSEQLQTLERDLFSGCSKLESIVIPESVTSIGNGAFRNCAKIEQVVIPDRVTSVGSNAFDRCRALKKVQIGAAVVSVSSQAFASCTNLQEVVILGSIRSNTTLVFDGCSSLERVSFGDNVTSIPNQLFANCTGLKFVAIGSSVKTIGTQVFSGCTQLWHILYKGTEEQWDTIEIAENSQLVNTVIHCNADLTAIHPLDITACTYHALFECDICGGYYCDPSFDGLHTFVDGICTVCGESEIGQEKELDGFRYLVGETDITILSYSGTNTDLVIPSEIDGKPVTAIAEKAFYQNITITSVVIPGSVKHIGRSAFAGANRLKSLSLQEGLQTIGTSAFASTKINKIFLPGTLQSIGENAFRSCDSLEDVYITDISHFLQVAKTLKTNPVAVNTANLYLNDELLTELVVPAGLTNLPEYAFSNCTSITSVVLPEGLESISTNAFSGCSKLSSIVMPDSMKRIEANAFYNCNTLEIIYLPSLQEWLQLSLADNKSSPLATNTLPKTVYVDGELLTEVTIPENITAVPDYAFYTCKDLATLVLPDTVTKIGTRAFDSCSALKSIRIPDSVTNIGAFAFSGCTGAETLTLSKNLTHIEEYAFRNCSGLTQIDLPDSLVDIGVGTFTGCVSVTELMIPKGITTIKSSVFNNWNGLRELIIPEGVVSIQGDAFAGCDNIKSVTIPSSLKTVGRDAFTLCLNLTDIYLPDIATWLNISWENRDTLMGENNLAKNIYIDGELIVDVIIPEGVKKIPDKAFARCESLEAVVIPDSVVDIGDYAFMHCKNLQYMYVGSGVTEISQYAFYKCSNLVSLFLPGGIEYVFQYAFEGCDSSECIVYAGTEKQLQKIFAFKGNDVLYEAGWHCESSCCAPTVQIKIDPNTKRPVLTWDDAPCVLAWAVYRSTSASKGYELVDIAYDTSFTDTTDAGGKKYYYIVGGISLAGELGSSSKYKAVTIPCASPVLSVSNSSSGYPTIKWKKVSGAKKYEVYYSTSVDGSYTKLTTTTSTSYTHSKASYGQKYYYKVKVLGSSSSLNSLLSEPVSAMRILARPALSVTVNSSSGKPSLSWKEISGAVSYDIYRAESKNGEFTKLANQTGVTYTDTTAKPDTDYWYKVMALGVTEDRNSAYSTVQKVHATLAKPKVTFSNNSKGKPTLSWKEVDGALSYRIYRSSYSTKSYKLLKTVKTTEYTDTSVSVGKGYYYKVIAVGADCKSAYSSYKKLYGKCAAPSITVAASTSSGKPVVKWSKVTGAKKYTVYRATSENGKYTAVKTTTSTSYTDTAATVGKTYFYKVKAIHKTSTYNSAYSTIKSCLTVCAKPVVSVKISSTTGKPTLSWKAISGAVSYEIYRAGADGQYTLLKTQNAVKYTDKDAQPDTDYRYKVKAIGSEAELNSAYSTVKKVHTTLAKPKVTFSNNSKGKPKLTWNVVDGAVSYRIYRSSYSTKSYKLLKTVKATEYTDTSVKVGKGYYYKVIAIGENCKSAYSSYKKLYGKCATPVITVAAKSTTGKPVIKWKKISGAAKYTVYRATEENGTYKALKTTSSLSYTDNSAKLGTTYYYKVKAVHKSSTYSSSNSSYALFECVYVVNTNTGKFHYSHCSSADDIYEENRLEFRGDRDDLVNQGYVPCKNCNP